MGGMAAVPVLQLANIEATVRMPATLPSPVLRQVPRCQTSFDLLSLTS